MFLNLLAVGNPQKLLICSLVLTDGPPHLQKIATCKRKQQESVAFFPLIIYENIYVEVWFKLDFLFNHSLLFTFKDAQLHFIRFFLFGRLFMDGRCSRVPGAVNLLSPAARGEIRSILRDICLETRFLLAAAEWAQAGRCFLTLMSLPNETSDRNGRRFTALLKSNIPGAAAKVNLS